ncbi:MAG: NAD-dependent epimerase/dehydratase family protein, partial [Burkholderiales bacterium]
MKILITGGGGFLGFRLAKALLARGKLGGKPITSITLLDGAFPGSLPQDKRLQVVKGDVADEKVLAQVCPPDTDAVFHLAAVVSGAAEADFDLGMRVNLKGTELLLAQMRKCAKPPRLVYTSSVAAFGGALPAVLDDSTIANPQTSYGAQKVIGEYLVSDYTRKGFLD